MGLLQVPRRLRGSHQSFPEPQPAVKLAGRKRSLDAANVASLRPSEERMWMSLLDQEGAGQMVHRRSPEKARRQQESTAYLVHEIGGTLLQR